MFICVGKLVSVSLILHQVKAVGGLLKYLEQARVGVELEHSSVHVPVLGLQAFTVYVYILKLILAREND